jgi:CheY-like chemotaxis protein
LDVSETRPEGASPAPATARWKVLVVDDEEPLRAIACEMLQYLGYTAEAAESGEAAVELVQNGASPDLVILDVIMPGIGGMEAFRRIRKARPDIKVLVATGFAERSAMDALVAEGVNGFVQKPYMIETLAERLKGLLP